ncbi:MAG: phosphatase PAP2 family protein [Bacteroidota bacterium]|nr:phosphatase PAP2 family protein [Bacteroidota bacterium]
MYKSLKENFKYLEIPDVTNQIFLILISIISIVFVDRFPERIIIPVINAGLCLLIIYFVSHYEKKPEAIKTHRSFSRFLRFWYPGFMILICFKEIYLIMISLDHGLYDSQLISIDQWMFGLNPTEYLSRFSNPYAVEFFQIIYGLFYVMMVIYTMELYLWHRYEELKYAIFVGFFGFYLSFIGYLLVPAIGPRFTLHNFHNINLELPGIFFADKIRYLIDIGESIPGNVANPQDFAQRDAFPSGHTILMILITYLSHKIRSNSFYFYLPFTILMIFSTVYLRYHYVIDLVAAVPVVLITIFVAGKLYGERIKFGGKVLPQRLNDPKRK